MGDRLRKAREFAHLSPEDMAHSLGVSIKTVNNYEKGRTDPRRSVLVTWAIETAVDPEWLMGQAPVTTGELALFDLDIIDLRSPTDRYHGDSLPWVADSMPVAS